MTPLLIARDATPVGPPPAVLTRRSPLLIRLFGRYVRSYVRGHFNAVRLSRGGRPATEAGPLVVVLNHPAWWDPLTCMVLSELFPGRAHFAPMDADALGRYRFFERLGFFGVRPGSPAGMRQFVRVSEGILARPGTVLWVTAQGRFTDPRQRRPGLQPGVGFLARQLPGVTLLPLALEYPFWEERLPEALARFGRPIHVADGRSNDPRAWTALVEDELTRTQDALAAEAYRRDPEVLLRGRVGVGGLYDVWRRLRAWLRGEQFRPEHGRSEANTGE